MKVTEYQVLVNRLWKKETDVYHCSDYFNARDCFSDAIWHNLFRGSKVIEDNSDILSKEIDYLPPCLIIDHAIRLDFYGLQTDILLVHIYDESQL